MKVAPVHRFATAIFSQTLHSFDCALEAYSGIINSAPRQIRSFRRSQPVVHFGAAYKCHLCVTTMKTRNFQCDDVFLILFDNFGDHNVLVFGLTRML